MPEAPSSDRSSHRRTRALFILVFAAALGLRLVGIQWSLPNELHHQTYHPDEMPNWHFSRSIKISKLDFTPGSYAYGTLYLTLLRVASDGIELGGGGARADDPASAWTFMGRCILAGRLMNAGFGALAAALAYLIFCRWVRPLAAALGALVLAVAPGFVVHARFATVDVLATLLVVASAYFALELIPAHALESEAESPGARLRWALLAGLCAGLSAGTKYTGALSLFTLFAALLVHRRPGNLRAGALGTLAAVLGFFASTPGALVDRARFWHDLRDELGHAAIGHGLVFLERGSAFIVHILNLIEGVGAGVVLVAAAGVCVTPARLRKPLLALLSFALAYYVVIGRSELMFLRYTFPLLLVLGFGTAALVERAFLAGPKLARWVSIAVVLAVCGVPMGGGLRAAAVMSAWMVAEDPRDGAARLLLEARRADPGATVGIVQDPWFYTPPLFPDAGLPLDWFRFLFAPTMETAKQHGVVEYIPADAQERYAWDVRLLRELQPTYVTYSSFESGDLERLADRPGLATDVQIQVDRYREFMRRLRDDYDELARFGGDGPTAHDLHYIRPTIWIWKRKVAQERPKAQKHIIPVRSASTTRTRKFGGGIVLPLRQGCSSTASTRVNSTAAARA